MQIIEINLIETSAINKINIHMNKMKVINKVLTI